MAEHVRHAGVDRRFRFVLPFAAATPITVEGNRGLGAPSGFRSHGPEGDRIALRFDGRDAVFPNLARGTRHHVDRTRPCLEREAIPFGVGRSSKPELAGRAQRQTECPCRSAVCPGAILFRHRRRTWCKGPGQFGCLGRRKLQPSRLSGSATRESDRPPRAGAECSRSGIRTRPRGVCLRIGRTGMAAAAKPQFVRSGRSPPSAIRLPPRIADLRAQAAFRQIG
jgi:hypothetical protein